MTFGVDSGPRHDVAGDGGTQLIRVRGLATTAEHLVEHLEELFLVDWWAALSLLLRSLGGYNIRGIAPIPLPLDLLQGVPVPFLSLQFCRRHVATENGGQALQNLVYICTAE
jgi:hypothetical protein